jgi:UPF0716 protein FxsA
MRLGLLLVLTAIPFLEIALMIKLGQSIGFWQTVLLIFLAMAVGTYVIYEQGLQGVQRSLDAMTRGHTAAGPLLDGAFVIFAGFLLIIPGFLTDVMGLALLVPPVRRRFAELCFRHVLGAGIFKGGDLHEKNTSAHRRRGPKARSADTASARRENGPVIDGEFHHVGDKTVDPKRAQPPPAGDN